MAKDVRYRKTLGNRLRFFIRFLGITGLLVFVIGMFVIVLSMPEVPSKPEQAAPAVQRFVMSSLDGSHGTGLQAAAIATLLAEAAIALWLITEVVGLLFLVTGRRTATGALSTVQIALASFLLVAVNVYSFSHYFRLDMTRGSNFTLPPQVAQELRTLNKQSPTTVVVLQKHQTFATIAGKQDSFDTAADSKVLEKVRDLVDQFRELGGRLRVVALDVNDKRYDQELAAATEGMPQLKQAIASAPESSIFFAAGDRVQRLSFSEFLQLDKTGSKEANGGKGNLVLREQGVSGFANRILAIQEKRPKAAILVTAKILSTDFIEGLEAVTLAGLKKSLVDHGFEVEEIFVRSESGGRNQPSQPSADSRDENRLVSLESKRDALQLQIEVTKARLKSAEDDRKKADEMDRQSEDAQILFWFQVYANFLRDRLVERAGEVAIDRDVAVRKKALDDYIRIRKSALDRMEKSLAETRDELAKLETNEKALEGQRERDVKAKLTKKLADVDLLIVPRLTIISAPSLFGFDPAMHQLSAEQAQVVKDFMKSGKPVLACLGPISGQDGPDLQAIDGFEKLLADRGIQLGNQTVLYNAEAAAYEEIRGKPFTQFAPHAADIPPLKLESKGLKGDRDPNPVGEGIRMTERSLGHSLDLRLRHPRPVALTPEARARSTFAAEFLYTDPESWNEASPYPQIRPERSAFGTVPVVSGIPEFQPTQTSENKPSTPDDERAGPFSVGVAIESELPKFWFEPQQAAGDVASLVLAGNPWNRIVASKVLAEETEAGHEKKGRLVVLGHGGIFTGPELKPVNEKLLLHSINWLLGRSDRLPQTEAQTWEYPRVNLSARQFSLWRWGTFLGLPLIAIYVGLIVLMVRKVR